MAASAIQPANLVFGELVERRQVAGFSQTLKNDERDFSELVFREFVQGILDFSDIAHSGDSLRDNVVLATQLLAQGRSQAQLRNGRVAILIKMDSCWGA